MATPTFANRTVLAFESRRAKEIATLIATFDGKPIVAPALRETPLESNVHVIEFADAVVAGEYDVVIFLTGVGARAMLQVVEQTRSREEFLDALRHVKIVARGPKPVAALREMLVPVWASAPEPNTWREVLSSMEAKAGEFALDGARIAVQEYGVSNVELLDALRVRGAQVTAVPAYHWMLPEDTTPLEDAVRSLCDGAVDVAIFTTGVQVVHLWKVARSMNREDDMRRGFDKALIASIGPSTSAELRRHGLDVDLEASHPKMGLLVREAAERAERAIPPT